MLKKFNYKKYAEGVFTLTSFTVPTLLKDIKFTDIFYKLVFYKYVHFISMEYVHPIEVNIQYLLTVCIYW